ncbi:MAG TPA: XrtA system polysaccharide deacetylase [Gemmatimonadaceae bacterium]|nr:XrtA system polysaccharide deacetylase [Gemmatimonadaceae bacterium]
MYQPPIRPKHFFTVDVEDYFQVNAFERSVSRTSWDAMPSRVGHNVDVLLDLLARHGSTGTFFTLGWVASRHPGVVRRIANAGHEIASHGWWHRRVTTLTPEEFREDVRSSKQLLEDVAGVAVTGFRAPSFSIVPGGEWAFDVLLEEGYGYDSSLFPINRPGYGYASTPPVPHGIQRPAGTLLELPLTTTVMAGVRVPASGGGYFRQFPYAVTRRAFREHATSGIPGMFYIHPWELDPAQPQLPVGWLTRVRHYRGLELVKGRLERLLSEFSFTSVAAQLQKLQPASSLLATLPIASAGAPAVPLAAAR